MSFISKPTHILQAVFGALLMFCLAATAATNSVPEIKNTKPCFQCQGIGKMKCPASGCKQGQADCPGPCLKLSKGAWVHMEVAGHSPNDVWQTFQGADGTGGMSWNQNHVGDVIQMQNGKPVNIGKCSICGGTGRTKCAHCQGTGEVVCSVCNGEKVVLSSWSAFDNPTLKNRPNRFTLKDGRVLAGRNIMSSGGMAIIRTETGDVKVATEDIVSEEKQPTRK